MLLVIVIPETMKYSSRARLETSPWNKRSQRLQRVCSMLSILQYLVPAVFQYI